MTTKKVIQANYSEDILTSIIKDYQAAYVLSGDNNAILAELSAKYGKTVPSLRAKLASLKVYVTGKTLGEKTPNNGTQKKEDITTAIADIVGHELQGLEVAPKTSLLALLAFLLKANKLLQEKEDKINSLIAEMLAENEPTYSDDLNDND